MNLERRALRQQILPAMKSPEMAQNCAVSGFLRSGKSHRHCIKELNLLEATSEYGGLSTSEKQELQSLRVRKSNLEQLKGESKKEMLELLEGQLADLDVEIDDALRQKKTIREELERHGDIEELSRGTKDNVKKLANCLNVSFQRFTS